MGRPRLPRPVTIHAPMPAQQDSFPEHIALWRVKLQTKSKLCQQGYRGKWQQRLLSGQSAVFATAEQKWEQAILHIVQNINSNTPKQVITEKPL